MSAVIKSTVSSVTDPLLDPIKKFLNDRFAGYEPWQIFAYACGTTVVLVAVNNFVFQEESLRTRTKRAVFKLMKRIPSIRQRIDNEMVKVQDQLNETFHKGYDNLKCYRKLPSVGMSEEEIMKTISNNKSLDFVDWEKGWVSGCVYAGGSELTNIATKTYGMFAWSNPLHPDVFPDVRKMDSEVVRMCCTMFNGDPNTCGTTTSGGTESILLACHAYRNMAYERGIKRPEIIAPISVHAAFDKAATYFRMKITKIRLDPVTGMVDVNVMRRAISRSTCVLVGSSPEFPHGIIDPIEEIAKLGKRYNIPVHVDACLGGFLVPFMEKAGFPLPLFDFRVDGVTSISADTHKFGFAPKGSSVILYRNSDYRKFQYFTSPDWPGGMYCSPTLAGSRPGAIIAACWATLMYMGEAGYVEATRKIITTARYIHEQLKEIDNIFVYGDPQVSVIAIGSDVFNIYQLCTILTQKGWNLNVLQNPNSVHICIAQPQTEPGVADRFVTDVRDGVEEVMKQPNITVEGAAYFYGMAQSIPDKDIVSDLINLFIDSLYSLPAIK